MQSHSPVNENAMLCSAHGSKYWKQRSKQASDRVTESDSVMATPSSRSMQRQSVSSSASERRRGVSLSTVDRPVDAPSLSKLSRSLTMTASAALSFRFMFDSCSRSCSSVQLFSSSPLLLLSSLLLLSAQLCLPAVSSCLPCHHQCRHHVHVQINAHCRLAR